ncbi:ribonuclease HII [Brachybacterium epidermidis]|uniref:ribonuclease HII n=1 Tax=Brachybacterium epidermidis TaxID=2781983 RepID=UPI00398F1AAD
MTIQTLPSAIPTLDLELALATRCGPGPRIVVGIDEVGRGALAGPVAVGACAIEVTGGRAVALPEGVRDSKALTARRRELLVEPIRTAARSTAVGWSEPAEIDELGIMRALTLAALRAIDALEVTADAIILDGSVDVLTPDLSRRAVPCPRVELRVKADRDCASTAAASILAKVARDQRMTELDALAPAYGWATNKGYGSAVHRHAIQDHGPTAHHRRSWNLGGRAPVLTGVLWDDQSSPQPGKERR